MTKEIGTILILFIRRDNIKLHNVALAFGYDSHLISLGQFHESGIIYHNNLIAMILMKNRKIIAQVKKNQNLFTFDLAQPRKVITIINKKSKVIAIIR